MSKSKETSPARKKNTDAGSKSSKATGKTKTSSAPDRMLYAAKLCAQIAEDKKVENLLLLGVREIFSVADYFVICTCHSKPQSRAVADEIEKSLKKEGIAHLGTEGREEATWILLDYGGVVVHVFLPETRDYYQIEMLWGDAPHLDWTAEETRKKKKS